MNGYTLPACGVKDLTELLTLDSVASMRAGGDCAGFNRVQSVPSHDQVASSSAVALRPPKRMTRLRIGSVPIAAQ